MSHHIVANPRLAVGAASFFWRLVLLIALIIAGALLGAVTPSEVWHAILRS